MRICVVFNVDKATGAWHWQISSSAGINEWSYTSIFSTLLHGVYIEVLLNIRKWWKGKATPLHAWTGPEGSRRFRLPDFKRVNTWRW